MPVKPALPLSGMGYFNPNYTMIRFFVFVLLLCRMVSPSVLNAQTTDYYTGIHLSLRGGIDVPTYPNYAPYIDYKPGLSLGFSADYYPISWFGLGLDFDYLNNNPRSIYPTRNLYLFGVEPFIGFNLLENRIDRYFLGGGVSFKIQTTKSFSTEFKIRGGFSSISGGYTYLDGEPLMSVPGLLNFHAGYNQEEWGKIPTGKLQLEFKYFFSEYVGFNFGAYYIHQFEVEEAYNPILGLSAGHHPFVRYDGMNSIENPFFLPRVSPSVSDVSSWGATAGITVRIPGSKTKTTETNNTPSGNIRVTARDVQSGQLLPNTQVVLKNAAGTVVAQDKTDGNGNVYFLGMPFDNYFIEGTLYDKRLRGNTIQRTELKNSGTVVKEILYDDPNFILKGEVVKCNTNLSLPRVSVVLKNNFTADEKRTITNNAGEYIFHVGGRNDFQLRANKEKYLSRLEPVSTTGYNRNTTLFIKLEICIEELGCGDIYNVYYDYNEAGLNPEGKRELDIVAQFLQDNPTLKAEIQGHTDIRGTPDYNKKLSIKRANSAKDYLLEQGIKSSRLSAKGYGKEKLLEFCNKDCPPEGDHEHHRKNRRTDVKVICPD